MAKILLTNDDGVEAEGLRWLEKAVEGWGELLVVAPSREVSGCSHAVTSGRALAIRELAPGRFATDGTPADCVRAALWLFPGEISLVLSGINHGANVGADVFYSGTVAAAREAAMRGVPAVAISQYRDRPLNSSDWERAAGWARIALASLWERRRDGVFWNINLPCLPEGAPPAAEVAYCPLDPSPLPLQFDSADGGLIYTARYSERARVPGSDFAECLAGKITVTEIRLGDPGW